MDILRPQIVRIGKRCYRKNESEESLAGQAEDPGHNLGYPAHHMDDDLYEDEMNKDFSNIEQTDSGYRLSVKLPSAYFKYIIGKKGETKRQLENETGTQIKIPRQGNEGDIVIIGPDKSGVGSAETRITLIVESARQRQPFTHFLSIPTTVFRESFLEFREDVLKQCHGDKGLDKSIFQNPDKLHITIGTLPLMNDVEIKTALDLLQKCKTDIIDPLLVAGPLRVHFRGLEYMNDDPREVDVLYAKVCLEDGSDRLQRLTDQLVEELTGAGLMQREHERVKLHVTVINSLMRKDPSGTTVTQKGVKVRESFDATNVLKRFGDYDFGSHLVDVVHLSQRFSTGKNGYYSPEGCVSVQAL